mgnify:CR=1 FL=1
MTGWINHFNHTSYSKNRITEIKFVFALRNLKFRDIRNPFFIRLYCIEIPFQLILSCFPWSVRLVFFLLFSDIRTNPQFLHNTVDSVFTVAGVVEMVDPACHPKWSINWMCKQLNISRAAYYKWLHRSIPEQEAENIKLAGLIKEYDDRFCHILAQTFQFIHFFIRFAPAPFIGQPFFSISIVFFYP